MWCLRSRVALACLTIAATAATEQARAQTSVDVEMAILIDTSGSVLTSGTLDRVLNGHMALFRDPRLMPFLQRQGIQSLAVSAFAFGTETAERTLVRQLTTWQTIRTASDARAFAAAVDASRAVANIGGRTPIGDAVVLTGFGHTRPDLTTARLEAASILGRVTPTGLLNNGITATRASGPRVFLNLVSDGADFPTTPPGIDVFDAGDDTRAAGVNVINAIATQPTLTPFAQDILQNLITKDPSLPNPPGLDGFIQVPLSASDADFFEAACRKFARELSLGTPAAGASCEMLLGQLRVIPRTERRAIERERVVGRRPLVTDVAVSTGQERSLTASTFLGSVVTDSVISETTLPNGRRVASAGSVSSATTRPRSRASSCSTARGCRLRGARRGWTGTRWAWARR